MIEFEHKQDPKVFVQAGYTACLMGIEKHENPYKKHSKPAGDAWNTGWERARANRPLN